MPRSRKPQGGYLCAPGSGCMTQYATESLRKGFFSKLCMACKEHLPRGRLGSGTRQRESVWQPPRRILSHVYDRNSTSGGGVAKPDAPAVVACLAPVARRHASAVHSSAETVHEGMELTRDVALFALLAFYSCRRGFDISNTLGSQVAGLKWIDCRKTKV